MITALDGGATKAAVCRTFGIKRSTLVDSLAQIGRIAGLVSQGNARDTTTGIDRSANRHAVDPATEQRGLVRYYTLSENDLAMIRRCRGDHSRLGYALMLCYLRYPGRHLHASERPPAALTSFVAEQIDVSANCIKDALASEQTRRQPSSGSGSTA